eukprot:CAMPEP_0114242298 /NCGR_PEP_ID=MMETSP0058-20121206/10091_1 /TAXON_ID=36894 /ORGANISM="Pyramimonas parkeae, CCMP726" /LENGTH=57 /DNA_ID=CAMNT_0001354881 /DNA_START=122 /DNA_END=295 /DNA_ORIENTATION=+
MTKPGECDCHYVQLVALGNTGVYNRLYTVTAQAPEKDFASMKMVFDEILASFAPPDL